MFVLLNPHTTVVGREKIGPLDLNWCMAVVAPTDRPKSVCNRCLIKRFCVTLTMHC